MLSERKVTLRIGNLTIEEVKKLLSRLREIEQREPERVFPCEIEGLEDLPASEVSKIVADIFPDISDGASHD